MNSFKEFYDWYYKFQEEHGFKSLGNLEKLYDLHKKRHSQFVKLFGEKIRHNIDYKANDSKITSNYLINNTIDNILSYIPDYLKYYDLSKGVFLEDKIGKVKLSKHILTYAEKNIHKSQNHYIQYIKNHLSTLERLKSGQKNVSFNYDIVISVKLEDFIKLGHHGPDNDSCFGQKKENYYHKALLAISQNTFVVLIYNNNKCISRNWGWLDINRNKTIFCLTNFYRNGITERSCDTALDLFYKKINKNFNIYKDITLYAHNDYIYLNEHPYYAISNIDCNGCEFELNDASLDELELQIESN